MGIWQYCFDEFRYPLFQFDKLFNGCHHVFSKEYHAIREWLLPGWLLAVQAFMTMSFLLSFGAQAIMALQVVRFPLRLVLRYEWIISSINFGMITTTSKLNFIFGEELDVDMKNIFQRSLCSYPFSFLDAHTQDEIG